MIPDVHIIYINNIIDRSFAVAPVVCSICAAAFSMYAFQFRDWKLFRRTAVIFAACLLMSIAAFNCPKNTRQIHATINKATSLAMINENYRIISNKGGIYILEERN